MCRRDLPHATTGACPLFYGIEPWNLTMTRTNQQFDVFRGLASPLLVLAALVVHRPPAAYACQGRVDLPAIDAAMANPSIDPVLLQQARDLRGNAAKAIEEGRASDGNAHYRRLMALLQLEKPAGLKRC